MYSIHILHRYSYVYVNFHIAATGTDFSKDQKNTLAVKHNLRENRTFRTQKQPLATFFSVGLWGFFLHKGLSWWPFLYYVLPCRSSKSSKRLVLLEPFGRFEGKFAKGWGLGYGFCSYVLSFSTLRCGRCVSCHPCVGGCVLVGSS